MANSEYVTGRQIKKTLKNRIAKLEETIATVHRKRSWRPAEKAMALADFDEQLRCLYALQIYVKREFENDSEYNWIDG